MWTSPGQPKRKYHHDHVRTMYVPFLNSVDRWYTKQYRHIFQRPGSKVMISAVNIFAWLFGTEGKWLNENEPKCQLISYTTENSVITGKRFKKKWIYTPAVRSKISSKLIFESCVWCSDRAHYELCVLIKDIGRRLPLQLQCSYQGQQDDFSQSVRGNYKTRFWGGQNLTAVMYHIPDKHQCYYY